MAQITKEQLLEALKNLSSTSEPLPDGSTRSVNILVKDIFGETAKNSKGMEYTMIHCEYRNLNYNKLEEKKCPIFLKEQAELIINLESGKTYEIAQVKEDGYWVWKSATLVESLG